MSASSAGSYPPCWHLLFLWVKDLLRPELHDKMQAKAPVLLEQEEQQEALAEEEKPAEAAAEEPEAAAQPEPAAQAAAASVGPRPCRSNSLHVLDHQKKLVSASLQTQEQRTKSAAPQALAPPDLAASLSLLLLSVKKQKLMSLQCVCFRAGVLELVEPADSHGCHPAPLPRPRSFCRARCPDPGGR